MHEERDPVPALLAWAALAALVVYSASERWTMLSASPYPLGVDGYFYPIQLRSLLATGHLAYPASPLAFWLLAPFAAACGPIVGAKLGAAVLLALVAVPAYGATVQLGRSRAIGIACAVVATRSAGSAYMTIEYVKNGIGLTIALAALWAALVAIRKPSRARIALAAVAVLAAVLAHKMAAAIVLAIAVPAAFAEAAGRGRLRGHRLIQACLVLGGLAVLALVAGILFPQRFLSPTDLALLRSFLTTHVDVTLPALDSPVLRLHRTLGHEPLLAAFATIGAAIGLVAEHRRRKRGGADPSSPGERVAAWAVVVLGAVVANPFLGVAEPDGLGYRIRVAAFVPLALALAVALRTGLAALAAHRLSARLPADARALAPIALAVAGVLYTPGSRTEGRVLTHPALIACVTALPSHVPAGDTVILPERHILFMVAWYTHVPVRLRPEGIAPEHRVRAMPMGGFILEHSPLDDAIVAARSAPGVDPPVGLHPHHRNGFVLVREPTWTWLLAQLPPRARDHWAPWPTI